MGLNPRPSPHHVAGYYYQDEWTSRVCRTRTFHGDTENIRKCLKNKHVQFYGDSTGRQWFEYLITNSGGDIGAENGKSRTIDGSTMNVKVTNKKSGPITAYDQSDNISLSYIFHGLPFTSNAIHRSEIDYIANRLDRFDKGGPDTVIVVSIWAHFWIADLQFYRQRLRTIKDAIHRLEKRTPGTRIFFKSPNTIAGSRTSGFTNWRMAGMMRVLIEEMSGFNNVTIINAWDMTIGHWTGLNIHPSPLIIEQEVDILLSFICPD